MEKINKIDKLLARFAKNKREWTQINKIRNERGEIIIPQRYKKKIINEYYKELYANKTDNLEEMDKFLETYKTESGRNRQFEEIDH